MDVSNPSRPIPQKRGPWSNGEDTRLIMLVQDHGPLNWVRIAEILGTRTPKQCRERYHQNLKPTLNRGPITNEEGQIIDDLVQTIGKKWAEIARRLNGRSDNAVKNWWNGSQNRQKRRNQSRRQAQEQSTITGREFSRMPVVRESDQPSHPSQTPAETRSPGLNGQSLHATTWHTATLPSPSSSDLTESEVEMNYTTSPASQAHSRESTYTYRPQVQQTSSRSPFYPSRGNSRWPIQRSLPLPRDLSSEEVLFPRDPSFGEGPLSRAMIPARESYPRWSSQVEVSYTPRCSSSSQRSMQLPVTRLSGAEQRTTAECRTAQEDARLPSLQSHLLTAPNSPPFNHDGQTPQRSRSCQDTEREMQKEISRKMSVASLLDS